MLQARLPTKNLTAGANALLVLSSRVSLYWKGLRPLPGWQRGFFSRQARPFRRSPNSILVLLAPSCRSAHTIRLWFAKGSQSPNNTRRMRSPGRTTSREQDDHPSEPHQKLSRPRLAGLDGWLKLAQQVSSPKPHRLLKKARPASLVMVIGVPATIPLKGYIILSGNPLFRCLRILIFLANDALKASH